MAGDGVSNQWCFFPNGRYEKLMNSERYILVGVLKMKVIGKSDRLDLLLPCVH